MREPSPNAGDVFQFVRWDELTNSKWMADGMTTNESENRNTCDFCRSGQTYGYMIDDICLYKNYDYII